MVSNPGTLLALDLERIYARNLEVPSGGGFYQVMLDCSGQPDPMSLKRAVQEQVLIAISLGNQARLPSAATGTKEG